MKIPCYRCGKEINTPNNNNADYIMAEDTVGREARELLLSPARLFGLIRAKTEIIEEDVQKTGVICPDCYRETDTIIWGVHKAKVEKLVKP